MAAKTKTQEQFGVLDARFADNLKRARLKAKLSQEALAAKCGVSTSYISMLERRQRSAPLETIETIAFGLGLTEPTKLLAAA